MNAPGTARRLGCPCGCINGVDCATERPAPTRSGFCACSTLTVDYLARGYGCAAHSLVTGWAA